ncbi:MAG: hypothetical protein ACKVXR_11875 [Planctomycetota bacterium]
MEGDWWRKESEWERRHRELEKQYRPLPTIRTPDLRPRSDEPFVNGDAVGISVRVLNEGNAAATPFDVVAEVAVPGRAAQTFTIRFPDLDPEEYFTTYIGTVSIFGIPLPVDISVKVTADPVTPSLPKGEVVEFDETDNVRTFPYRIH